MNYKVAIVDDHSLYLNRICRVFSEKYADKITLYSYSDLDGYKKGRESNRFDIVIFAEGMISPKEIPQDIQAAYFVGENDIDKIEDYDVICKYQKHELLFKQIMELCLESENIHYSKKNVLGNVTKVLYVTSAQGGAGTSIVAASVAKRLASAGKKVLYLSFENNAITDTYFNSTGEATFSDVIYLLKSKKSNMISRLENIVQKDESGVYFFNQCKTVFDMSELTVEDLGHLLKEICAMGSYEYIVADSALAFNDLGYFMCDYSDKIVVVTEGSKTGVKKLERLSDAMSIWDEQTDSRMVSKSNVVYNKFDTAYSIQPEELILNNIGFIPDYKAANEKDIMYQISAMPFWEILFS